MYLLIALGILALYGIAKLKDHCDNGKHYNIGNPEIHLKMILSMENQQERQEYLKSLKRGKRS